MWCLSGAMAHATERTTEGNGEHGTERIWRGETAVGRRCTPSLDPWRYGAQGSWTCISNPQRCRVAKMVGLAAANGNPPALLERGLLRQPPLPHGHGDADILAVYEIRNCLVHAGDDLSVFVKADLIRAFAQRRRPTLCREQRLDLEDATAKIIARVIYAFLEAVYDAALVKFPGHYGRRRP
jgi:hypothetical protein